MIKIYSKNVNRQGNINLTNTYFNLTKGKPDLDIKATKQHKYGNEYEITLEIDAGVNVQVEINFTKKEWESINNQLKEQY